MIDSAHLFRNCREKEKRRRSGQKSSDKYDSNLTEREPGRVVRQGKRGGGYSITMRGAGRPAVPVANWRQTFSAMSR